MLIMTPFPVVAVLIATVSEEEHSSEGTGVDERSEDEIGIVLVWPDLFVEMEGEGDRLFDGTPESPILIALAVATTGMSSEVYDVILAGTGEVDEPSVDVIDIVIG
jgi:hypothetical protein